MSLELCRKEDFAVAFAAWPKEWEAMQDPVCPLLLALYGHPDAGGWVGHAVRDRAWDNQVASKVGSISAKGPGTLIQSLVSWHSPPTAQCAGPRPGRMNLKAESGETNRKFETLIKTRRADGNSANQPVSNMQGSLAGDREASCSPAGATASESPRIQLPRPKLAKTWLAERCASSILRSLRSPAKNTSESSTMESWRCFTYPA